MIDYEMHLAQNEPRAGIVYTGYVNGLPDVRLVERVFIQDVAASGTGAPYFSSDQNESGLRHKSLFCKRLQEETGGVYNPMVQHGPWYWELCPCLEKTPHTSVEGVYDTLSILTPLALTGTFNVYTHQHSEDGEECFCGHANWEKDYFLLHKPNGLHYHRDFYRCKTTPTITLYLALVSDVCQPKHLVTDSCSLC
jgi:hypothetical protein